MKQDDGRVQAFRTFLNVFILSLRKFCCTVSEYVKLCLFPVNCRESELNSLVRKQIRCVFKRGSESRLPAAIVTMRSDLSHCSLSWTVHTPAGGISSASPAEPSAPGCEDEQTPASDRLPLESSGVTVSRKVKCQKQRNRQEDFEHLTELQLESGLHCKQQT